MKTEDMERIFNASRNTTPEELQSMADLIAYTYGRLKGPEDNADGQDDTDRDEIMRSFITESVLVYYGKELAAKGRALPVKKEDTVNITRQDIVNVLRTELYNIANMKRDCEAVKEVCGGIAPVNRIAGCLNGMQQITEGLLAVFSTADSSAVIGLELIGPGAPTGGT